jgi:hypothetical protein
MEVSMRKAIPLVFIGTLDADAAKISGDMLHPIYHAAVESFLISDVRHGV